MEDLRAFWDAVGAAVATAYAHPLWGPVLTWTTVIVVAWLANYLCRRFILRAVHLFAARSRARWDDVLVDHKVFHRLSQLAPALVVFAAAPLLFQGEEHEGFQLTLQRLATAWMYLAGARAAACTMDAFVTLGGQRATAQGKPLRSYAQVAKLVMWLMVGIVVVGTLIDRSPWALLTGLGAMTAIILLVFKDSILGFVASIQIASYDMVRQGDWVEMPKYGADGDVVEISLHTVKVQNWDKTITTIPTHAFMSDSFKNWRGMQESGGRRIKRSIRIDMQSVRFLDGDDLKRLQRVEVLKEYLATRSAEVESWNAAREFDRDHLVNGRRLTNLGTFRAYLESYLRQHSQLNQDMTFLVRQLEPTPEGLPIQIYVFSAEQRWAHYESLAADIFDHVIAVVPEFDLRVFQKPSGADLQGIALK